MRRRTCLDEEAWRNAEEICRFWNSAETATASGTNVILMISERLGPNIALKLYKHYITQSEECLGYPAEPLFSLDDLLRMLRESTVTKEEGQRLYIATRDLIERKCYRLAISRKD